jgi:hypothetical protein
MRFRSRTKFAAQKFFFRWEEVVAAPGGHPPKLTVCRSEAIELVHRLETTYFNTIENG